MTSRAKLVAAVAAVALSLPACADADGVTSPRPGDGGSGIAGAVTVFAAASLTQVFGSIGTEFEAAHPGTTVTFNFAGSSTLARQINQGAPADVFASASPENMTKVTEAGNTDGDPITFVRNQLVIAVPEGNPHGITGLADLIDPALKVAWCAGQVPCGAAARRAVETAGLSLTPVTLEPDVKAALSKLTLGEVDAALVYRTDTAAAASEVDAIEFPESDAAINDYPIVVLREAPNPTAATAFVAFVQADQSTSVLAAAGFQLP